MAGDILHGSYVGCVTLVALVWVNFHNWADWPRFGARVFFLVVVPQKKNSKLLDEIGFQFLGFMFFVLASNKIKTYLSDGWLPQDDRWGVAAFGPRGPWHWSLGVDVRSRENLWCLWCCFSFLLHKGTPFGKTRTYIFLLMYCTIYYIYFVVQFYLYVCFPPKKLGH